MDNDTEAMQPTVVETQDELHSFFGPRRRPDELTAELIVNQFLTSTRSDLRLVKDFPLIEKVFRQNNTTVPSSAPVERLFSHGGNIFNKKRQNLTDENFEMGLILKINRDYWISARP